MSRLEKEYKINDTAEERRITLAIITAGAIIGLILSVIANIALLRDSDRDKKKKEEEIPSNNVGNSVVLPPLIELSKHPMP